MEMELWKSVQKTIYSLAEIVDTRGESFDIMLLNDHDITLPHKYLPITYR